MCVPDSVCEGHRACCMAVKCACFFFFSFWKSQPRHGDCCLGDNIKDQPSLIRIPWWERERMTVCLCMCVCNHKREREHEESERERDRKEVKGRERSREREWMCGKNTRVWVGGRRMKENVWMCESVCVWVHVNLWEACMDGSMIYE